MRKHTDESGVALITTVIVVAVLAVVAVAFMQSTTLDRASARAGVNYFRAQLAAEAGLAAGMAQMAQAITQGRSGQQQWNYVSGQLAVQNSAVNAEASTVAFIAQVNPANGTLSTPTLLVSAPSGGSTSSVTIPVAEGPVEPEYPAGWILVSTTNTAGAVSDARYAFWVSDDTTKLNQRVHGLNSVQSLGVDPGNVPLLLRDTPTQSAASTRLPSTALASLASSATVSGLRWWNGQNMVRRDSLVLTPETTRLLADGTAAPSQSLENDLAPESLSSPVAPNGQPKVNLSRLKAYLDSLPKSQQSGNLRFQAVAGILDAGSTDLHARWGGGDLSFLVNPSFMGGKYTAQEARQLVANLFDAIDEDFIPTIDDRNNPTVFGTEMRLVNGQLQGHPVLVYAGTGHFAGTPNPNNGNSRIRTHLALGFANPWPSPSEAWNRYNVEMNVTPSDPLFPTLTTANAEQRLSSPPGLSGGSLPARSGFLFPCGSAAQPHYSAFVDAPFNRQVTGLTFQINTADLIYRSTEGDFLVARLPGSPALQANPSTIPAGGDGVNRTAWQPNRQSYWLRSDFRLSPAAANWTTLVNGAGGGSSGIIPGPSAAINYMASANQGDGAQGLLGRINANMTSVDPAQWYRSASITNHLGMDGSLLFTNGATRIRSSGFLGFLSVGKPWQTVTLHAQNANNPPGREDWKLLDFVYSGDQINATNEVLFADMGAGSVFGPGGARAGQPGLFSPDGAINVHSPNRNSWRALFSGVVSDAIALADELATTTPGRVSTNTFDFLRNINLDSGATNDFARERPLRFVADSLTSRSRSFTVYAVGEALAPAQAGQSARVISSAYYRGRVRVGLDTNTGGVDLHLIEASTY